LYVPHERVRHIDRRVEDVDPAAEAPLDGARGELHHRRPDGAGLRGGRDADPWTSTSAEKASRATPWVASTTQLEAERVERAPVPVSPWARTPTPYWSGWGPANVSRTRVCSSVPEAPRRKMPVSVHRSTSDRRTASVPGRAPPPPYVMATHMPR